MRLLRTPYRALVPVVLASGALGAYSLQNPTFGAAPMAAFGVAGFVLVKLRCEPAPLLLGFVRGPMMEEHFRRAMLLSRGDAAAFLARPISAAIPAIAALALLSAFAPRLGRRREETFVKGD